MIPPRFPFKIKNLPDVEGFTLISRHHECDEDNARLRRLVMDLYSKDTPCAKCKSTCYDKCVRINWACDKSVSKKTHPICETCCSSIVGENKCFDCIYIGGSKYFSHYSYRHSKCHNYNCEGCQSMIKGYAYEQCSWLQLWDNCPECDDPIFHETCQCLKMHDINQREEIGDDGYIHYHEACKSDNKIHERECKTKPKSHEASKSDNKICKRERKTKPKSRDFSTRKQHRNSFFTDIDKSYVGQECVKRETIQFVPRKQDLRRMSWGDNPIGWSKQYRNCKTWAHTVTDGESSQYNSYDKLFPKLPEMCGICLNNIETTELWETNCGHNYHIKCLGKWLDTTPIKTCPMCRSLV